MPGFDAGRIGNTLHIVDTTMFFAPEGGGVGRYLMAKHRWFARNNAILHSIVVPGASDAVDSLGVVTVSSPAVPGLQGYRFPWRLGRWTRRLLSLQPHLIEVGDPYVPAWAALQAGQALGVPVIAFYHSDLVRMLGARIGKWSGPIVAQYVRNLYRHFDVVLAPSRYVYDRLAAMGVERLLCQPLGVDTELFHPARRDETLRTQLGLNPETRLLIFAGRFAREKNLPMMLQAFQLLGKDYHLLVVGAGMTLPRQDNVTIHPYQSNGEQLARLMASCDALVHAGDQETFGLIVLEAMACGLPAVVADSGALPELVGERTGIRVPPRSAQTLADGIEALYQRDRSAMGRQARAMVETNYDWNRVMRALAVRYAQMASAPVNTPPEPYATF